MRILVIEDNEDHAGLICGSLNESLGDATATHESTLEAVFRRPDLATFDAVVTDLSLPDAIGLETVRQIREHVPDVPLIVLSCVTDDQVALQALEVGA